MRPGKAVWFFCMGLCMAGVADAADVRKCIGKGGNSYVSGACPPGTREAWLRRVVAEPVRAADPRASRTRADRAAPRSARKAADGHARQRRSSTQAAAERACEAAKRRRDEVRDRDWYTLTYEQLGALDRRVERACR